MTVLAASCYLTGVAIGLQLDIRMTISATLFALLGALGAGLMGWSSAGETVFGAFVAIASLQTGYVSIVVLDSLGIVETKERAAALATVRRPSASDNP